MIPKEKVGELLEREASKIAEKYDADAVFILVVREEEDTTHGVVHNPGLPFDSLTGCVVQVLGQLRPEYLTSETTEAVEEGDLPSVPPGPAGQPS